MNWYLVGFILLVCAAIAAVWIVRDAITFDPAKAVAAIKALFAKKS